MKLKKDFKKRFWAAYFKSWPSFFYLLGRYKKYFPALVLIGAMEIALQAGIRYASQKIIDDVLPQKNFNLLLVTCFMLGLLALSQVGLGGIGEWWSKKIAGRFTTGLKQKVMKQILQLPLEKSLSLKTGGGFTLIQNDAENVGGLLQGGFLTPIKGLLMLLVGMGFIFLLNPMAGGIYLLTCVAAAIAGLWFIFKMRYLQSDIRDKISDLNSRVNETLMGGAVIKSSLKDLFFVNKNSKRMHGLFRSRMKSQVYNIGVHRLSWFVYWMFIILAWLIGGAFWIRGEMSLGQLVAFHFFADFIFDPIFMLIHSLGEIQTGLISSEKIHQLMLEKKDIQRPFSGGKEIELSGAIGFRNVSYCYPNGNKALSSASFEIKPGSFTVLAGPSGAGKSTLLKLILRLMDASEGEIFIGKTNIQKLNLKSIRRVIEWVPQDIWLWDESLAENIFFGNPDIKHRDIEAAAKTAECYDFISKLPRGFETKVGELGNNLSGGEKQRITLARALAQKPKILLLDEFSSALDPELERKILFNLKNLKPALTIIAAAHRVSLTEAADEIIYLENGRVKAQGSLEALKKNHKLLKFKLESAGENESPQKDLRQQDG